MAESARFSDPLIGRELGPARLTRKLGQGGMGAVYLGRHLAFDIDVAVKVLPASMADNEVAQQRFLREARSAARIEHANLVRVLDVGVTDEEGIYYLVMEFVDGQSVAQLMDARGGRLPIDEALRIVRDAANGLAACHRHGIIHRDIKPDNLMLTASGQVKVADFGLARESSNKTLSMTGSILGSPAYMSAEQASGQKADGRSDVASLGLSLYAMLAGDSPFNRANPMACLLACIEEPVPPLAMVNNEVPLGLSAIVEAMIERDRERRVPTMERVIELLAGDLSAAPASLHVPAVPAKAPPAPDEVARKTTNSRKRESRMASRVSRSGRKSAIGGRRHGGPRAMVPWLAVGSVLLAVLALLVVLGPRGGAGPAEVASVSSGELETRLSSAPASEGSSSSSLPAASVSSAETSRSANPLTSSTAPASSAAVDLAAWRSALTRDIETDLGQERYRLAAGRLAQERADTGDPQRLVVIEALVARVAQARGVAWRAQLQALAARQAEGSLAAAYALARALNTYQEPAYEAEKTRLVAACRLALAWAEVLDDLDAGRVEAAVTRYEKLTAVPTEGQRRLDDLVELAEVSTAWRRGLEAAGEQPVTIAEGGEIHVRWRDGALEARDADGGLVEVELDELPAPRRGSWAAAWIRDRGGRPLDARWAYRLGLYLALARSGPEALPWLRQATGLPGRRGERARALVARLAGAVPPKPAPRTPDREAIERLLRRSLRIRREIRWDSQESDRCKFELDLRDADDALPDFAAELLAFRPFAPAPIEWSEPRSAELRSGRLRFRNAMISLLTPQFAELHELTASLAVEELSPRAMVAVHAGGRTSFLLGMPQRGQAAWGEAPDLRFDGDRQLLRRMARAPRVSARARRLQLRLSYDGLTRQIELRGTGGYRHRSSELQRVRGSDIAFAAWGVGVTISSIKLTVTLDPDRLAAAASHDESAQRMLRAGRVEGRKPGRLQVSRGRPRAGWRAWPGWQPRPLSNRQPEASAELMPAGVEGYARLAYVCDEDPGWTRYRNPRLRWFRMHNGEVAAEEFVRLPYRLGLQQRIEIVRGGGRRLLLLDGIPLLPTRGERNHVLRSELGAEIRGALELQPRGARLRVTEFATTD